MFFLICLISLSTTFALESLNTNHNTTGINNSPRIQVSYTDRVTEGKMVTLDASKSFDPDRDSLIYYIIIK